jgi:hypothetical protein
MSLTKLSTPRATRTGGSWFPQRERNASYALALSWSLFMFTPLHPGADQGTTTTIVTGQEQAAQVIL